MFLTVLDFGLKVMRGLIPAISESPPIRTTRSLRPALNKAKNGVAVFLDIRHQ